MIEGDRDRIGNKQKRIKVRIGTGIVKDAISIRKVVSGER